MARLGPTAGRLGPTGGGVQPQLGPAPSTGRLGPSVGSVGSVGTPQLGPSSGGTAPALGPGASGSRVQLGPTPTAGAFSPSEMAGLETAIKLGGTSMVFDMMAKGQLTKEQAAVAMQIAQKYQRPSTTMQVIGRALNLGVNLSEGVAQSWKDTIHDFSKGDIHSPQDLMKLMPAWWYVQNAKHGFKEIPDAVWHNKSYDDFLKENTDPNTFLYRHAMPIGLAMDIALDPTTYLTFGATAGSKIAARGIVVAAYESSAEEARVALEAGYYIHPDGFKEVLSGTENAHELAGKIHFLNERPFTFGDGMAELNKADKALPQTMRAKAAEEGVKVTLGMKRKAAFRALAPRGGFGIRIMGEQLVPVGATQAVGKSVREAFAQAGVKSVPKAGRVTAETTVRPEGTFSRLSDLSRFPDDMFTKLNEDVLRTMITDQTRQIPRDASFLKSMQIEEARQLFKVPENATAGTTTDLSVLARGKAVAKNIFGRDTSYVPYEVRRGLMRDDFKPGKAGEAFGGPYARQLKDIKAAMLETKQRYIDDAMEMGFPDHEVDKLHALWDDLIKRYDDPLDVATIFPMHVGHRIFTQKQIDSIFANPMFAAVISEHTADLEKATRALDYASDRRLRTFEKLKAAKKAKKPKSTITRFTNQLEEHRAEEAAAKVEHARLSELQASELTGKRVVEDEAAFRARIGQDTVVETWKGKKYAVPQMVADALKEMRNPKAVDVKLEKALKTMNWAQNKWKILATLVNPSFHVMNLLGGMWNNMLGGTNNFFDHTEALASSLRARSEASDKLTWTNKIRGRFSPIGERPIEEQLAAQEARRQKDIARHEFMTRVGAGGGLVHYDIADEGAAGKQLLKSGPDRGINIGGKKRFVTGSPTRRVLKAARVGYGTAAIGSALLPDEWVPDDVQDALNPVLGGALLLPEGIRAGRATSSVVEDTLRTAPLIAAEKDQALRQLTDAFSVSPPTHWGKYMGEEVLDLNRVQQEAVWSIGARNALHYQFDYSDLNTFERMAAKTVFPFYVFYKNNFVLQAREVVNKPRFVNTFLDVQSYMDSLGDNEDNPYFKDMLPEYFDKLNMFRVPVPNFVRGQLGIPEGQDVYLNPKLPFASLNLFPPLWNLFQDGQIKPTPQKWAEVLAPAFGAVGPLAGGAPFKPALEYSVGYNLGLARPIDFQRAQSNDFRQSFTPAPGYLQLMPKPIRDRFGVFKDPKTGQMLMHSSVKYITDQMASPFLGSFGDAAASATGDSASSAQQKANTFAWISGVRLTPVDPIKLQRGWLYRMENYLAAQKGDYKSRGIEFPEEDTILLAQIRAQLKGVENAYDAEQANLFGGPNGK